MTEIPVESGGSPVSRASSSETGPKVETPRIKPPIVRRIVDMALSL